MIDVRDRSHRPRTKTPHDATKSFSGQAVTLAATNRAPSQLCLPMNDSHSSKIAKVDCVSQRPADVCVCVCVRACMRARSVTLQINYLQTLSACYDMDEMLFQEQ